MTNNPTDFQNPEVPTNQREFYMLYFQNMNRIKESFEEVNKRLDEIVESQTEDRENILSIFDKWDVWKKAHDDQLSGNLQTLTRNCEKIDQLEKKVNTWSLTNTLAAIGAFIAAIFIKGS